MIILSPGVGCSYVCLMGTNPKQRSSMNRANSFKSEIKRPVPMPHDRLYGLLRLNVLGSSTRNYNIQMIVIYLPYIVFVPLSPRAGEVANARVWRISELSIEQCTGRGREVCNRIHCINKIPAGYCALTGILHVTICGMVVC